MHTCCPNPSYASPVAIPVASEVTTRGISGGTMRATSTAISTATSSATLRATTRVPCPVPCRVTSQVPSQGPCRFAAHIPVRVPSRNTRQVASRPTCGASWRGTRRAATCAAARFKPPTERQETCRMNPRRYSDSGMESRTGWSGPWVVRSRMVNSRPASCAEATSMSSMSCQNR